MTTVLRIWIVAAILCGLLAPHATALHANVPVMPVAASTVDVPKNDGWVTDQAHLLSPGAEKALEAKLEAFKQQTGHEIAVLTVPSLNGQPIESFALDVGRAWGMGSKERSDAALLVVSQGDRKMRIEVARGLEGVLPDILCGRIIADLITPEFRRSNFTSGIEKGVDAMMTAARGEVVKLPAKSKSTEPGIGFVVALFFFMFIIASIIGGIRHAARGTSGGRPSILPWLLLGGLGNGRNGRGGGFGGGFGGGGGGGGFGGFGGGGGFSGGGSSGGW